MKMLLHVARSQLASLFFLAKIKIILSMSSKLASYSNKSSVSVSLRTYFDGYDTLNINRIQYIQ